jgi:hypothetical protein
VLGVVSTLWLGLLVNWLSAGLALAAIVFYVVVYTMLLKRRTTQNIVWGGAAGCFPALIGWTAVTGSLAWAPVVLFARRLLLDAAALLGAGDPLPRGLRRGRRADAAGGGAGARTVGRQIVAYSWVMVATSLLLWPVAGTGWFYPARRRVLGGAFLVESHLLLRVPLDAARRRGPLQADAAVPLVEHVPLAAVRRGRARPAADPLMPRCRRRRRPERTSRRPRSRTIPDVRRRPGCGCCSPASTPVCSPRGPGTTSPDPATASGRRCTAPGSRRGCCARRAGRAAGWGWGSPTSWRGPPRAPTS